MGRTWRARVRSPLICAAVAACSSGPGASGPPPAPERAELLPGETLLLNNDARFRTSLVQGTSESLWPRLLDAYLTLDIPIARVNGDEHVVVGARFRATRIDGERLSTFVNCGQGMTGRPNADTHTVTLTVGSTLKPGSDPQQTVISTRVEATAESRATAADPFSCASRGRLETMIAEMIGPG